MTFRLATENDIPQIVHLLKCSLGDSATRKTEAFWRWKHLENPFGSSPVLLAETEGRLVGVRAFMPWQWQLGEQVFHALRPVDTATHPNFRRQGIFRRLTLQLIEDTMDDGADFLFNTPNVQSRAGYLKMGWKDWGRLSVRFSPNFIISPAKMKPATWECLFPIAKALDEFGHFAPSAETAGMFTPKDREFFWWRYVCCPVKKYGGIGNDRFLLIFTLRKRKQGLELRIVDALYKERSSQKDLFPVWQQLAKTFRPRFFSSAPSMAGVSSPFPPLALGPRLTVRSLNASLNQIPKRSRWQYSLGDMELF